MTDKRRVHPDCRNASNPYHECSEYCFRIIAQVKKQMSKAETGILQANTADVHHHSIVSSDGGEDAPAERDGVERHNDADNQADGDDNMVEDSLNLTGRK